MQVILLDEQQTSIISQSHDSVSVRDHAGVLLGHIVPAGAHHGPRNRQFDKHHWVECWNDWYAGIDEPEPEKPETD